MSFKHLLSGLVFVSLLACTTNPLTGRKQLSLISSSSLLSASYQSYQTTLSESKLSTNKAKVAQVKRVGRRIQKAVERYYAEKNMSDKLAGFEWEFNLIESPQVNAWCMPGGKVAFYTGILPVCKSETGIAVVMGHEIAHAVANHSGERASLQLGREFGLSIGQALAGENPSKTQNIILQAAGASTSLGMLKFSRSHESESDHMGLVFMAMAGYNPREAPKFWERMSAAGGQTPPEFLSTHPSSSRRVSDLKDWMPEALEHYKR
ncbi:MAG: M48 family metallopeptidase [Flavobacteriales bacterium]